MEQIHIKVGKNLNRIRKSRGLSLDQVAELTGVSKAMLAQIERGDSNPTISVLWKIAGGLRLSFTSLIEEQAPEIEVVSIEQTEAFVEDEGHYRSYPIFPFHPKTHMEIYAVEMDPGCTYHSDPHSEGVEEYIIVHQGTLDMTIGGQVHTIGSGSAVRFSADVPHTYRNLTDGIIHYHAVIYYP